MAQQSQAQRLADAFHRSGQTRRYAAGKQLFLKGDEAREIYLLDRGRVRAYLLYPDGAERTLCYVGRGNLVGEEVAAQPPRRIVCADAHTDITLTSLDNSALLRLVQEDEAVLRELMSLFMQKIELLSSWIFYGRFSRNEARLACFLYTSSAGGADLKYTQAQIAAVTGMSRLSVSQCLGRLAQNGLVRPGYGAIRVLDRPGLRAFFYDQAF